MPQVTDLETRIDSEDKQHTTPPSDRVELRPLLGFVSIATFFCSTLEISLLEYVDSFLLRMTLREVVAQFCAALIVLFGLSLAWWLCTLVVGKILCVIPRTRRYFIGFCWYSWLAFPFSYFMLESLAAIRLVTFSNWYPGATSSLIAGASLVGICSTGILVLGISRVQGICRTRFAPIGWVHIALGVVATLVLFIHGISPFHDITGPNREFAGSRPPDVYLISIDALRAEEMSAYDYHLPTTPNLERFAEHSFKFENFIANSNLTTPTTTSIETGKLPWSHRVFQLGGFVRAPAQRETLAARLRQRGYYTAMISSNIYASPFCHSTVENYDAAEYARPLGLGGVWMSNPAGLKGACTLFVTLLRRLGSLAGFIDDLTWRRYPYPAEAVFDRARTLIESHGVSQPIFVWTHIFPPHDPYWPPPPYQLRFAHSEKLSLVRGNRLPSGITPSELRSQYDEMVLYADHVVGDYLDWLERTGRLDRAIVIVTADHGESFEHGWFLHGGPHLYHGLIHIPLLIHLPRQERSQSVSELAQQADLLPTILDLVGATAPDWTDGISLKPLLEGKTLPQRDVFSMALESVSSFRPIDKGLFAVMDDDFKYVLNLDTQKRALYRYATDPLEEHNLIESSPETAGRMDKLLRTKLKEANDRFISR